MGPDTTSRRIVDASLLRAIVDQFVERLTHPIGDIKQFEQLALGLIDIVDAAAVARVARPLCFHRDTPQTVFIRLYEKGGPCAEIACEYSPVLPHATLLATAQSGDAALAAAVARRRGLDREIIEALAQRSEREVLRALASNVGAHLDASARRALALAARDDLTLARMLLDRDDLSIDPEPLFLAANRLERTGIILDACRKTLAGGMAESRHILPEFAARLEASAIRRNRDGMAALMAEAFECRKERARMLLSDASGEALALALSALGVEPDDATRIFLCADASISHDTDRVRALVALVRSTPARAAARIVSSMTGARADKDAARRAGSREEALAGPSRRRAAPRLGGDAQQKIDQTA